jgi:cysteinyl-tRNA synthetase
MILIVPLLASLLFPPTPFAPQSAPPEGLSSLKDVKTWMFQFQNIESKGAVDALARSRYDLLVVEPTGTYRSGRTFDMKAMVDRLRAGKRGRVVLAYFDLAQADSNRAYWEKSWRPPEKDRRGTPDFLLKPDPDGWKDTYVVRYSDARWQDLMIADVKTVMAAGFDGLCLDWLEGYEDKTVRAELKEQSLDPARVMVDFVARIRQEALKLNPTTRIVIENAPHLIDADPRLVALVDAVLFENTWFQGKAEVDWDDAKGGDQPNPSTDDRLKQSAKWQASGKPVLTLDYCLNPENAKRVYESALGRGFVPLVSRTALDRITETPPPGLK